MAFHPNTPGLHAVHYTFIDKIEDTESLLIEARAKKMAIEAEKLTADNIYKVLIYFDKLYAVMDEQERRQLMESLISEIHIFEERKPNGQWLKSIKFKLPIIEEDMEISLDNDTQVETCRVLCVSAGGKAANGCAIHQAFRADRSAKKDPAKAEAAIVRCCPRGFSLPFCRICGMIGGELQRKGTKKP